MKVTNRTAYATIGCDVQLSENDRLALGIELDKIIDWLNCYKAKESETESIKAMNKIIAFVCKCAIRPSQSNVFTDSPEEFEKADEQTDETVNTNVEPDPTDNVITVNISKSKNLAHLARIVYYATDMSKGDINECLLSVKGTDTSCVSFRCTQKTKWAVVDELTKAGYTIEQNTARSWQLDNIEV